jgi:hypothetical protein
MASQNDGIKGIVGEKSAYIVGHVGVCGPFCMGGVPVVSKVLIRVLVHEASKMIRGSKRTRQWTVLFSRSAKPLAIPLQFYSSAMSHATPRCSRKEDQHTCFDPNKP